MEKEEKKPEAIQQQHMGETEDDEAFELVLFQVSECYVYIIPPRKTAASYRADEWDVNKWAWEGSLKVISKGEECIIRLEDKMTGELYARAFLRKGEPHPVEPVIDSSRYFVLRIEENIGGRLRHAFIGIGFRERTQAYDFQAALHDHMKYLNKKQAAEEMEQQYQQNSSSVDYSLKEGETLVLQLKSTKISKSTKAKVPEHGHQDGSEEKGSGNEPVISIKPPPPPHATLSPTGTANRSPENSPPKLRLEETSKDEPQQSTDEPGKLQKSSSNQGIQNVRDGKTQRLSESESTPDVPDDDFGDFQTAG